MDLYNKRYTTLAAHQAAVKARATLEKGKNVGPVANADAYGSTLKKAPKNTAVRSASTGTNSAATSKTEKKKPADKKATLKPSPKAPATKKATKESRSDGLRNLSNTVKTPKKSARDKMPYAGKFPGQPNKKDKTEKTSNKKTATGTARGGSRASNNNRKNPSNKSSTSLKKGATKTATIQGVKYIMTWTGSRWTSKKAGGKG